MPFPTALERRVLLLGALLTTPLVSGCFDSGGSSGEILRPTLIAVAPEDFLGRMPCSKQPGTLRRYVATFIEVNGAAGAPAMLAQALSASAGAGGAGGVSGNPSSAGVAGVGAEAGAPTAVGGTSTDIATLPSSPPVGCQSVVVTSKITLGSSYVAEIDGYEETELSPTIQGGRGMLDVSGKTVAPRWTTRCAERPVMAIERATQFIRFCEPLKDSRSQP